MVTQLSTAILPMAVPNIILFGETGSGKSSIVNMIAEREVASMSSGATGCTFQNMQYQVNIMGSPFNIYDTTGLDEGDAGKVPKQEAIVQLYRLIKSLDSGVNLLIFCMRGPRIKDAAHKNWILFREIICQSKVPTVIAITGLEQEEVMEDWWYANKGAFQKYEMNPAGHACITATRGKKIRDGKFKLDEEYDESKETIRKLIMANHLEIPWRMEKIEWFKQVITTTYSHGPCGERREHKDEHTEAGVVVQELVKRCEMSQAEALTLAHKLNSVV